MAFDTATLPQTILDDESLCAYGGCVEPGLIPVGYAVRAATTPPAGAPPLFRLCAPHGKLLLDFEGTQITHTLSLDGRGY